MTNHADEMRSFVVANFLFGDGAALGDDTPFLGSGIVDSTGVLDIITFLENTYHIKVEPAEMLPENLDSISRITRFLSRKLSGAAALAGRQRPVVAKV